MREKNRLAIALIVAALALATSAAAQRRGDDPRRQGRGGGFGAAQLNVADGDVTILHENGDRVAARAGDEIFPGDRVITGSRSRAEIQLARANLVRLGDDSEVEIEGLGNRAYRLELVRGLLHYSQLRTGQADVDIKTAVASIEPVKPSVFSVEARSGDEIEVTVRDGAVEVFSDRGLEKVKSGHSLSVRSFRDETAVRTAKAEPKSDFDAWSKRRNKMLRPSVPYQGFGPYWGGYWSPAWGPYWGSYWGRGFGYGGFGYGGFGGFGGPFYGRSVVVVGGGGRRGHR
ncbi:MAG: hypothetical protein GC160_13625 [Acidobacteria bacterium]|nr:hypothetical protein [Acidobacteriota bacterium]